VDKKNFEGVDWVSLLRQMGALVAAAVVDDFSNGEITLPTKYNLALTEKRKAVNLSQRDLAEMIDVPYHAIGRYEKGLGIKKEYKAKIEKWKPIPFRMTEAFQKYDVGTKEISELCKVSRQTAWTWVSGKITPPSNQFRKIRSYLNEIKEAQNDRQRS